ncbi:MAG: hypothetical protein ACE5FJ_01970, partial [Gemmatimonadales bacterium]
MRFNTYSKYTPELIDALNMQELIDQLSDFLLDAGFAGGHDPFWGELPGDSPEHALQDLKDAILRALMQSGQLTPEMLQVLRGEGTGDEEQDRAIEQQLADLIDQIIQKLIDDGYAYEASGDV